VCCQERVVPVGIKLVVNSAIDAILYVDDASFCDASSSSCSITTQQNTTLNTTLTKINCHYIDIAKCLGWSVAEWKSQTYAYSAALTRSTFYVLMFYCLTNLKDFKGIALIFWVLIISMIVTGVSITFAMGSFAARIFVPVIYVLLGYLGERYTSIKFQVSFKWLSGVFTLILVNVLLSMSPQLFANTVNKIIAFLPIVVTALQIIFSKFMIICFADHRENHMGMAFLITAFLFNAESIRLGSFLALYIGYKKNVKKLSEVLLNMALSLIGELHSHSGLREVGEKWLGKRIWFIDEEVRIPEVRWCMNSMRQIFEWVTPVCALNFLFIYNFIGCYPLFENAVFQTQANLFTTKKLLNDIWELLAIYYGLELVSLLLCRLIAKWISHKEISALGTLEYSRIYLLTIEVIVISPGVLPIYYIPCVTGFVY